MPNARRRLRAILSGILLLTGMAGCQDKSSQPTAAPPPPPTVEVVEVTPREVPIQSEWIATLNGSVNAVVSAQVNGYIVKQNYTEGALVKKGDALFEIDDRPFKAALEKANGDLAKAKASLGKATLDVERYTPLAKASAISQQELDDAVQSKAAGEASVTSAQALVDQAQLNLGFTKVTSLIDGVAGLAKAQIGDLVGPATGELTSVSTVDPIRAYLLVSEQEYMRRLKQNADLSPEQQDKRKSNFELTLASGEKFGPKGHFLFVDRQVNVRTGTLTVAIEFPNPGSVLRPGQYGMVRAVLENRSGALVVPQRAVGERQGVNMVAVVGDDNKVTIKPVKTGERVGSDWIISSGLKPGDRVIAEGLMKVKAGTVVETRPYTGGKADSGASKGGDGAHATTQGENR
jgi:membrane fusion protein (multidrug efflux system)